MSIAFAQPIWFGIVLLAIPLGFIAVRWCVAMARARRWSAVLIRALLLALLASMLAGASSTQKTNRIAVIGVLDVSESVRRFGSLGQDSQGLPLGVIDAADQFFRRLDVGRGPEDLLGLVVFGGDAVAVVMPTPASVQGRDLDIQMTEGTNIAGAIRLASAMIPPDATGRLVLISDGNETGGDALAAAEEVAASDASGLAAIDVVPVSYSITNETMIESVIAPANAPPETTATVRVVIVSVGGTTGTLSLTMEGEPVDLNGTAQGTGRRLDLGPGRHVVLLDVPISNGRIHRFKAEYEPDRTESASGVRFSGDSQLDNNTGQAFTMSPGVGTYLLVDGVSDGDPNGRGAILARALQRAGADVRQISPDAMPTDVLGFQPHDLVILENVPADAIAEHSQRALAAHVRDMGGGLIMVGGPDSFGSGGWAGTPIEPILPVKLDLAERLVERRTAIVLVLDGSGSMASPVGGSFRSQQEIANAAAAAAARSLGSTDLVGVIRFSSSATWVRKLGPNDEPEATTNAIESISSGGGTNIPPALVMAGDALGDVKAAVKHVIVLSDGRSSGEAVLPGLCERLAEQGINVSTISIGDAADTQTMYAMAERGGGVHYPVTNPNVLPRVFVRAVRLVRDPLIKEGAFVPVVLPTGSPALTGLTQFKPLDGLVLTRFREDPTVTNALATPEDEPVLAHWSAGLGRVAAFTSDTSTWATPWLGWSGFDVFWSQLARLTARPPAGRGFELSTDIKAGRMRVRLLAYDADGEPIDGLLAPAVVYAPEGERIHLSLEQVAPGEYTGSTPATASGNYIAVIQPRDGAKSLPPVLGGATQASSIEYRQLRSNPSLLERISKATGGRVLSFDGVSPADLFDRKTIEPRLAESSLWRLLLVLSIVVMLMDVATRRIAWDRYFIFRRGWQAQETEHAAEQTLGLLRRATAKRSKPNRSASQVDADARAIAIEARRQRQEAKLREVQSKAEKKPAKKPVKPTPAAEPESGLLAAKRRARQRFEQEGEP